MSNKVEGVNKVEGIRHGDVNLIKIKTLPSGLKQKDNILAYGEITGHRHVINGECKVMVDTDGNQYVDCEEATLSHEEHKQLQITKGFYRVVPAREIDLVGAVRQVMD
jgi:hypothetical protein